MTTLTLTERDVCREYDIPVRTLQGWRLRGGGPEFLKCGRSVRYRRDAIEKWLDNSTRRSTSDMSCQHGGVRCVAHQICTIDPEHPPHLDVVRAATRAAIVDAARLGAVDRTRVNTAIRLLKLANA